MFHLVADLADSDLLQVPLSPFERLSDHIEDARDKPPQDVSDPSTCTLRATPHLFIERSCPASGGNAFPVLPLRRTHLLFVLAIPSFMSKDDFLLFLLAKEKEAPPRVASIRFFIPPCAAAGEKPDRYAALVVCRSQQDADSVYQECHGRSFPPPATLPPSDVSPSGREAFQQSDTEESAMTNDDDSMAGDESDTNAATSSSSRTQMVLQDERSSYSGRHEQTRFGQFHRRSLSLPSALKRQEKSEKVYAPTFRRTLPISSCCYLVFVSSVSYRLGVTPPGTNSSDLLRSLQGILGLDVGRCSEIPVCPICVEKIDACASGILTKPDGWDARSSSVCAPCTLVARKGPGRLCVDHRQEMPVCSVCNQGKDTWVCLICGHIGCGRYTSQHAKAHYTMTTHRFSIHLFTGRIWDYLRDVFVHRRLIQRSALANENEISLPNSQTININAKNSSSSSWHPGDAVQFLCMELDAILASQLDHQRHFYENQFERVRAERIESNERRERLVTALRSEREDLGLELQGLVSLKESLISRKTQQDERVKELERNLKFLCDVEQGASVATSATARGSRQTHTALLEKKLATQKQVIAALQEEVAELLGSLAS